MPPGRAFVNLRRVRLPLRVLPLALLAGLAFAQPAPAPEPGLAVITAASLLADVAHLSSPQYDGRLSGSRGYVEALRVDFLAFSGHKGLLGPQGTGGLYVEGSIAPQATSYQELYAVMVDHARTTCLKAPRCDGCVVADRCEFALTPGRKRCCPPQRR
ncbi:MAG: aminotransferase class V-fold PLP-dependent enzyme [Thiobacillus sp.]|nr:aminotransferase class V-fold PLP-dependent enzyme [Thiobacillus sp.]